MQIQMMKLSPHQMKEGMPKQTSWVKIEKGQFLILKRVNQSAMIAYKVHKTICVINKHRDKYFMRPAANAPQVQFIRI